MTINKIDSITQADLSNVNYDSMPQGQNESMYKDFWKVTYRDTEGASGEDTSFTPNWMKWHGYYRQISIFAAAIDKLTSFTIGKGYKADKATKTKLNKIKGWGKDDFNSILENQLKTAFICGDSFAEIIKDKKGRLINLKPLSPGSIKILVFGNGMLKGYSQRTSLGKEIQFKKEDVFHLSHNRTANEIHGIPLAERMEDFMKMIKETQLDQRVMFHRYVVPITLIPVDTDDPVEMVLAKKKIKNAYEKVEPILFPKDTIDTGNITHLSIPQYSIHDPMPWLRFLTDTFAEDIGVAKFTGEKITEASAKIIYLAFQQAIERCQRFYESQLKAQLGIKINLEFPASIAPELVEDEKKDGSITSNMETDPDKKTN